MKRWHWAVILLSIVLVLLVVPFVVASGHDFAGADSKAQGVITTIDPGYKPWFKPLWVPSSETATMLFSLQAAIGASVVAFAFGYWAGRSRGSQQDAQGTAGKGTQSDARLST